MVFKRREEDWGFGNEEDHPVTGWGDGISTQDI